MTYIGPGQPQIYRAGVPQFTAGVTDPATIAGVKAWWKASSIAQADSSAVTTWTDSISSIAPTQATAGAKPTYRTTQGPNSTPAVSFDGGDHLTVSGVLGSALFSTNQCHIFIVQKQTGSDGQNATCGWYQAIANQVDTLATYDDVIYWDFGDLTSGAANGRMSVAQPSGWDDSWRLLQLIRDTSNNQSIRDQGSQLATASRSKTVDVAQSGSVFIGAYQSLGVILTGFIADILVYNVALPSGDRALVEAYFNSIYTLF